MIGTPLTDFLLTISSICLILILGMMFCCLYIKLSDLWMAKRENIPREYLNTKLNVAHNPRSLHPGPEAECCAIYVPDLVFTV